MPTPYYSFASIEFGSLRPDGLTILPETTNNVNEIHFPWSDTNSVQFGGRNAMHFRARIRMTPADTVAMVALPQGTVADLVLAGITYVDAVLASLTNVRELPHEEYVMADADFIL